MPSQPPKKRRICRRIWPLLGDAGHTGIRLAQCAREQAICGQGAKRFRGGVRSGVNGTPSFFISGMRHDGSYDFAALASGIDMQLHGHATL